MKKTMLAGVAATLLLSACAGGRVGLESTYPERSRLDGYGGYLGFLVKKPNPTLPNIFVEDDAYLIVDQDPIRIKLKQNRNPVIAFALDANQEYVFDDQPISIVPVGNSPALKGLNCPVSGSGAGQKTLVCTYDDPTERGKYGYTLRVKNARTGKVIVSDPTIVNDF